MSISILGSGAFGTALAISLARDGRSITLWSRDAAQAGAMQRERVNTARLPGHPLPDSLRVTAELAEATADDLVLLALPTQQVARFLEANKGAIAGKIVVAACKGLDLASGQTPHAMIEARGARACVLSGPSFADDIAAGLPTALTLAAKDDALARDVQQRLACDALRLYRSTDRQGVALGGALKNVIALAAGMAMGARLGESARAALMTRGYAEMVRFASAEGAQPETLSGLSGFGDLVLTCTSARSRNYAHGLALGEGKEPPKATVEGAATAKAVSNLAEKAGIAMPISNAVAAILDANLTIHEAMDALLSRPLTKE